jgi:hypothetical protein
VTNKSVDALCKIVNPYQKPVALSSWFVEHFSNTGDWVADLCCGTGGTLVALLLKNRCGAAVDKSDRQVEYVKKRIITLEPSFDLEQEAKHSGDGLYGQEIQLPLGDGKVAVLSTCVVKVSREDEEESEMGKDSAEEEEEHDEEQDRDTTGATGLTQEEILAAQRNALLGLE